MVAGNGGGTMAAFVFGLVLSNYRYFAKKLDMDRSIRVNIKRIVDLNEEITFLLKSYYFLYIGLIVTLSPKYLIAGLGIVAILLLVRFVTASGVSRIMKFTKEEKVISRLVFTLGTSTLVMSQLPSIYDPGKLFILNQDIFPDICFPVVLGTVIFGALVSPKIARRQLNLMK
jgi:cell volume regulation protein A